MIYVLYNNSDRILGWWEYAHTMYIHFIGLQMKFRNAQQKTPPATGFQ